MDFDKQVDRAGLLALMALSCTNLPRPPAEAGNLTAESLPTDPGATAPSVDAPTAASAASRLPAQARSAAALSGRYCGVQAEPGHADHNTFGYLFPQDVGALLERPSWFFMVVGLKTRRPQKAKPGRWLVGGAGPDGFDVVTTGGDPPCFVASARTLHAELFLSNDCTRHDRYSASRNRTFWLAHRGLPGESSGLDIRVQFPQAGRVKRGVEARTGTQRIVAECGLPIDHAALVAGIHPPELLGLGLPISPTKVDRVFTWNGRQHRLKPFGLRQDSLGSLRRMRTGDPLDPRAKLGFTPAGALLPTACFEPARPAHGATLARLTDCREKLRFTIEQGEPGLRTVRDPAGDIVAQYERISSLSESTAGLRPPVRIHALWHVGRHLLLAESWEKANKPKSQRVFYRDYWNQYLEIFTREELALLILGLSYPSAR